MNYEFEPCGVCEGAVCVSELVHGSCNQLYVQNPYVCSLLFNGGDNLFCIRVSRATSMGMSEDVNKAINFGKAI